MCGIGTGFVTELEFELGNDSSNCGVCLLGIQEWLGTDGGVVETEECVCACTSWPAVRTRCPRMLPASKRWHWALSWTMEACRLSYYNGSILSGACVTTILGY